MTTWLRIVAVLMVCGLWLYGDEGGLNNCSEIIDQHLGTYRGPCSAETPEGFGENIGTYDVIPSFAVFCRTTDTFETYDYHDSVDAPAHGTCVKPAGGPEFDIYCEPQFQAYYEMGYYESDTNTWTMKVKDGIYWASTTWITVSRRGKTNSATSSTTGLRLMVLWRGGLTTSTYALDLEETSEDLSTRLQRPAPFSLMQASRSQRLKG